MVSYKVGRVQGALLLVGPRQNKGASLRAHRLQKLGEIQGRWNTACGNALWAIICKKITSVVGKELELVAQSAGFNSIYNSRKKIPGEKLN